MGSNFFSLSSQKPYLSQIKDLCLDEIGLSQEKLTHYHIILPTRRMVRELREQFVNHTQKKALLLPRIYTYHEMTTLSIYPKQTIMPVVKQHRLLATLLKAYFNNPKRQYPHSSKHIFELAEQLRMLLEKLFLYEISFTELEKIVPDNLAAHWQETLSLLEIFVSNWPELQVANNQSAPATALHCFLSDFVQNEQSLFPRANILFFGLPELFPVMLAFLKHLQKKPNVKFLITEFESQLLKQSEIPSLDIYSPYRKFLTECGVPMHDIAPYPNKGGPKEPANNARQLVLTLSLQETINLDEKSDKIKAGFDQLYRFDTGSVSEEARLIGLLIREALAHKDKRVMFVTPNRKLARLVIGELKRWQIDVDDSAGVPLDQTPLAVFLKLSLLYLANPLDPFKLISLLKHPYCTLGFDRKRLLKIVRRFEKDYIRRCFDVATVIQQLLDNSKIDPEISLLLQKLQNVADDFMRSVKVKTFKNYLSAHLNLIHQLSDGNWQGHTGHVEEKKSLLDLLTELQEFNAFSSEFSFTEYQAILSHYLQSTLFRKTWGHHPRVAIVGPLQASYLSAERVILGGLNEESWPSHEAPGPWLSISMREQLGLPGIAEHFRQQAENFYSLCLNEEVFLTRSTRIDGVQSLPSRWLANIERVVQAYGCEKEFYQKNHFYRALLKCFDLPKGIKKSLPLKVIPPLPRRPVDFFVTHIQKLLNNPYQLFVERILKLRSLDPLIALGDAKAYGLFVHDVMERFLSQPLPKDPKNALKILEAIGKERIKVYIQSRSQRYLFAERFKKSVQWWVEHYYPSTAQAIYSGGNEHKDRGSEDSHNKSLKL